VLVLFQLLGMFGCPMSYLNEYQKRIAEVFGSCPPLLSFDEANKRSKASTFEHDTKDLEADPVALAAWQGAAFVDAGDCFRWLSSLSPELRAEAVEGEWVFGWFVEDDPTETNSDPEGEFVSSLSVGDLEDLEDLRHAVDHASRFGCLFVEVWPKRPPGCGPVFDVDKRD
jgi:hypothetical protein